MKPASKLKMPFVSPLPDAQAIRLENTLRDLQEKIARALDEEEVSTFTLDTTNVCIGIAIGLFVAAGFISLEASTGFFRWLIYSPDLSWLLPEIRPSKY